MALSESHRVIWLDFFIGQDDECHEFKRRYCTSLDPDARVGDPIDMCIQALNESAAPIIFVSSRDRAMEQIELHRDKRIVLISSGALGQDAVPYISQHYPHVYSFNIFCALVENHVNLAIRYAKCLKIFTSEVDLLVRLIRDLSLELINQGRCFLQLHYPERALDYFRPADRLEGTANEQDKLNTRFLDHLRLLHGHSDKIGLIQTAELMKEEQKKDHRTQGPPISQNESQSEEQNSTAEASDTSSGEPESQESQEGQF